MLVELPLLSWSMKIPSEPRTRSDATRKTTGRAITPRVTRSQNPPRGSGSPVAASRRTRPMIPEPRRTILVVRSAPPTSAARTPAATRYPGAPTAPSTPPTTPAMTRSETNVTNVASRFTHGQSVRSPRSASSAGRRVIAASSDISVTKIAPAARLRKIVVGRMNMPEQGEDHRQAAEEHRAVRRGAGGADRLELGEPLLPFLAVPGHDEQRIVDPDGKTDHRDDVDDEQVELDHLPDQRDESHREHDRDDRHHDGNEGGHDRAEHDHQNDQSDGDADRLALPGILFRDRREVGEQGRLSGDLGREGVRSMLREEVAKPLDGFDLVIRDRDGEERRRPVRRHEAGGGVFRLREHVVVAGRGLGNEILPRGERGLELTDVLLERRIVHRLLVSTR